MAFSNARAYARGCGLWSTSRVPTHPACPASANANEELERLRGNQLLDKCGGIY
ncbi:uncharacterized protein BCR38DRAFT_439316 [Pseudomassariella vexata]|uniref:Uncharacterized protein n=1 Tax=Pseudomassariella vexata TaxID=1141098 RepID=A0A1Y2DU11_9PEZI|nr:uncharacterized protein BCR38DRAFT_439316 [Pseudomassariella vexata]ORY62626.1 hypothetical protein BCR38DRAFT_439316 [Pseudomassariella vexata]